MLFSLAKKKKSVHFLAAKFFAGPGDPDIFEKIRIAPKVHAEEKFGQSDVHPIIG